MGELEPQPKSDRLAWLHKKVEKLFVPEGLFHGVAGEEAFGHIEETGARVTFIVPKEGAEEKIFALILLTPEEREAFSGPEGPETLRSELT